MIFRDYEQWYAKKRDINSKVHGPYFHEREVWFAHMGVNIGFEQDGKGKDFGRPVVIFRKFNNEVFWTIPLTTKKKKGKFYLPIYLGDGVYRAAILSQLRLFDGKRLYQKFAVIDKVTHKILEQRVIRLCRSRDL